MFIANSLHSCDFREIGHFARYVRCRRFNLRTRQSTKTVKMCRSKLLGDTIELFLLLIRESAGAMEPL